MTRASKFLEDGEAQTLARRERANQRLGWALGAAAILIFLLALWKFRPF